MITEYHDIALVEAISAAVDASRTMCGRRTLVRNQGGRVLVERQDLAQALPAGTVWEVEGHLVTEYHDGAKIRTCIMTPASYRCMWADA